MLRCKVKVFLSKFFVMFGGILFLFSGLRHKVTSDVLSQDQNQTLQHFIYISWIFTTVKCRLIITKQSQAAGLKSIGRRTDKHAEIKGGQSVCCVLLTVMS